MLTNTQLKARLQKLVTMADRGTPAEAALAASQMQRLMQEHNLTLADAEASEATTDSPLTAKREQYTHDRSALYRWQRNLMEAVAEGNFCLYIVGSKWMADPTGKGKARWYEDLSEYVSCKWVKRHVVIGRSENVAATQIMYDYLVEIMERLNPYPRGANRMIWMEGCSATLCNRLEERASGRRRSVVEDAGTPGIVRLTELYGTEEDLNNDFRWEWEPGTTARLRREEEAREAAEEAREQELIAGGMNATDAMYVARGMTPPSYKPQKVAKSRGMINTGGRLSSGWTNADQRKWERQHSDAFRAGKAKGEDIGLGGAVARSSVKGELE